MLSHRIEEKEQSQPQKEQKKCGKLKNIWFTNSHVCIWWFIIYCFAIWTANENCMNRRHSRAFWRQEWAGYGYEMAKSVQNLFILSIIPKSKKDGRKKNYTFVLNAVPNSIRISRFVCVFFSLLLFCFYLCSSSSLATQPIVRLRFVC